MAEAAPTVPGVRRVIIGGNHMGLPDVNLK